MIQKAAWECPRGVVGTQRPPGLPLPTPSPVHRASGATSLGKAPGPSCWQGGDLIPCSLSGASISWFREGMFGDPWAAAPGPGSAAAP